jgi:hypothetical protein
MAKSTTEVLAFYKSIRRRYPDHLRIYLVNDNLSLHWTPLTPRVGGCAPRGIGPDTDLGQPSQSDRVSLPTLARNSC